MKKWSTAETKFRIIMKLGLVQSVLAMVFFGISAAHEADAQLLEKRISITLGNVTLQTALHRIEEEANFRFAYSEDQLNLDELVSIRAEQQSLGEILENLFTPRQIQFKVHEKEQTITLRRISGQSEIKKNKMDFLPDGARVSGKVTAGNPPEPLAGVNVIIKGTSSGTTTDADGRFSIMAEEEDVLVFSFIGYTSFEAIVSNRTIIDVFLLEDSKNLSEVVVNAGYYTTTRNSQTSNIGRIEASDIQKQPVQNFAAALQGRIPGLEIVQQTGVPGGNFKVRIRGTSSIANGNEPLYIVDGVPFTSTSLSAPETSGSILGGQGASPLAGINPSDIASIEVLKDADATAIYGSRGSNGVILITTKKGTPGNTRVDFNFYAGAGVVASKMDLLNSKEYLRMRREAFANDKITPTAANARDLILWDTTRQTDWQKTLIGGTAQILDGQLGISGGDKQTQFTFGTGYHRETTVFPGENSDQRISLHSSITNTYKKLKTSFSVNYAVNQTNLLKQDLTSRALSLPATAPALYDDTGKLSWVNWSSTYENPVAFLNRKYESTAGNLIGNLVLSYDLLPNLSVKTSLGYTSLSTKAVTVTPLSSLAPDPTLQGSSTFLNSSFNNWVAEPQINWKPAIGIHKFDVLAGTTFLEQSSETLAQTATGFASEALMKNLASATTRTIGTNSNSQYRYQAFFGRINYSILGRYFLNITGRRDGSSRFGPGNQFATFGAVGAAWVFSEESFLKTALPFISFGKLRASIGTSGNDQIGDYQYLDSYKSSGGPYLGTIGLQPDRLSNPNFAWETNKKFEVGLEFGFLRDRIQSTICYYQNNSSSQLVGFPLPATTGFPSIQGNFPATVRNSGVEIEISTRILEVSALKWSASVNMSVPRNELVEFPNLAAFPAYANLYAVGQPLAIRKLYNYTGIYPTTGVYTFLDYNGDGTYTQDDRQIIRFIGPDYYGGLLNSFQYKGFQLDFMFQFVKQTGYNYSAIFDTPGTLANQPKLVMDRWTAEGSTARFQRFGTTGDPVIGYSRFISSQESVGDASYVRLKNVSFSYTIPKQWADKMSLAGARIFIQGQNLLTITSYEGLDPETQGAQLPPLKVISGGFHLTF